MRKLEDRKSRAIFETTNAVHERGKQRQVVLELKPGYMMIRVKGTRAQHYLSYTAALNLAIRNEVAARKLERAKKRARR